MWQAYNLLSQLSQRRRKLYLFQNGVLEEQQSMLLKNCWKNCSRRILPVWPFQLMACFSPQKYWYIIVKVETRHSACVAQIGFNSLTGKICLQVMWFLSAFVLHALSVEEGLLRRKSVIYLCTCTHIHIYSSIHENIHVYISNIIFPFGQITVILEE